MKRKAYNWPTGPERYCVDSGRPAGTGCGGPLLEPWQSRRDVYDRYSRARQVQAPPTLTEPPLPALQRMRAGRPACRMRIWQVIGLVLLLWITLVLGTAMYSFITTGKS